jgi:hypothetical protein
MTGMYYSKFKSRAGAYFSSTYGKGIGALARDPLLVSLLVFSGLYFLFYYFTEPVRPADVFTGVLGFHDEALYKKGWFGYIDQGWYLKMSEAIADFDFSRLKEVFMYGLGYPVVAVPFLWLGFDKDPFVFFNLFAFVFAVYATYKAGKHFISPVAGLIAGFGLAFATPLVAYTVQPWNSTICLFAVSCILLVAIQKRIRTWHALLVGLVVGWAFAARYVDIAFLGLIGAASLYRIGNLRTLLKNLVLMIAGISVLIVPVLYAHDRAFGSPLTTPYIKHLDPDEPGSDQQADSFSLRKAPETFTAIFIGPKFVEFKGQSNLSDNNRGLLVFMFWALAAIPGAYILFRKTRNKLFVSTVAGFILVTTLFYLSFRGTDTDAIKYGLLHYFKMLWPCLAILAAAFFDSQYNKIAANVPERKRGRRN